MAPPFCLLLALPPPSHVTTARHQRHMIRACVAYALSPAGPSARFLDPLLPSGFRRKDTLEPSARVLFQLFDSKSSPHYPRCQACHQPLFQVGLSATCATTVIAPINVAASPCPPASVDGPGIKSPGHSMMISYTFPLPTPAPPHCQAHCQLNVDCSSRPVTPRLGRPHVSGSPFTSAMPRIVSQASLLPVSPHPTISVSVDSSLKLCDGSLSPARAISCPVIQVVIDAPLCL